MKTKRTKEYFKKELRYIQSINKNNPGSNFNYDPECFKRYVNMQATHAERDGFKEISDQMRNHIK